jgi:hypothetical protein
VVIIKVRISYFDRHYHSCAQYIGCHQHGREGGDERVSLYFLSLRFPPQLNPIRFALKFQKIVQDEQEANFITRLHAGKLQIIPWPVIGSREFYTLFSAVKQKLDQQKTSLRTAGEFLLTLKTLMAKLKVRSISFSEWQH